MATLLLYVPLYSRKGRIHVFAEVFVFDQGTQIQTRPPCQPRGPFLFKKKEIFSESVGNVPNNVGECVRGV